MKTNTKKTCLLPLLALLLLAFLLLLQGCASASGLPAGEDRGRIKRVIVATELEDSRMNAIDLAVIRDRGQAKESRAAVDDQTGKADLALVREAVSGPGMKAMIGGSLAPVDESLRGYDTKAALDRLVFKGIMEKTYRLHIVHHVPVIDVRISNGRKDLAYSDGDALLKIGYRYGLGASERGKPFPAMIAAISVESPSKKKTLLTKTWTASACEKRNYALADYTKDGGKIYRACFEEMAEQFGQDLVDLFY